jgi:3-(3-hydroxy-phenyl)propionate hydroxylase
VAAVADGRVTSLHAERGPDFTVLGFGHADADQLTTIAAALRPRLAPAVGVRVLVPDDADSVAAFLGAEPGEVLVIRPDGLLLARYPSAAAIDAEALAAHILSGGSEGPIYPDDIVTPTSLSQAERTWRVLSDALDKVPAEGREAFLTRLVLLLSLHEPDPEAVQGLVAEALDMER